MAMKGKNLRENFREKFGRFTLNVSQLEQNSYFGSFPIGSRALYFRLVIDVDRVHPIYNHYLCV